MKNTLVIVDPQNDFCDSNGALFIPNADKDCIKISNFIKNNLEKLDSIHISMDSHSCYHIAHPYFWKNKDGEHPKPYTIIRLEDFKNKKWIPYKEELQEKAERYITGLNKRDCYELIIWPLHCLTASWGSCIQKKIFEVSHLWEISSGEDVNYIVKGLNQTTDHYSIVQAEVPDPSDDSTKVNMKFIESLKSSDRIFIAGEALSHCVSNTIRDLSTYIPMNRITLLIDCTSNVEGFEEYGDCFLEEYSFNGLNLAVSTELKL